MDLSGVSFLSGFAAGVGIGLFLSHFDAACDKKQQAGVNIDERLGGVALGKTLDVAIVQAQVSVTVQQSVPTTGKES